MAGSPPTMTGNDVRRDRIDGVALFALLFLCYAYTFPRWADWNQNSRFDLVVAIVEHGTLSIDCCVANTGDYALVDGRAYSDKAPGLSFLAVPVYAAFRAIASTPPVEARLVRLSQGEAFKETLRAGGSGLLLEKIRFALGLTVATVVAVALPSALFGVAFYVFLARFTARRGVRLAVTLAYALATPAFTYGGSFYAHQLVAALLFTAFILATRPAPQRPRAELAAIGFLLGFAVITEYPAVLITAPIAALALWRGAGGWGLVAGRKVREVSSSGQPPAPSPQPLLFFVAASLPLALCAAYDWAIFGTPLPVGYRYSALWQERHSTGFISLTYPHLEALWGITFGTFRGLFVLSPVLLLALPGFVRAWRRHPLETALSAWAVASFIAFNGSSVMWWGGFAVGPRYIVPMLPFLAWPMVVVLADARGVRGVGLVFAVLFAVSLLLVWGLTLAEQQYPPESAVFAWRDWAWPNLVRGNIARNVGMLFGLRGWSSLVPLLAGATAIGALWRWAGTRS